MSTGTGQQAARHAADMPLLCVAKLPAGPCPQVLHPAEHCTHNAACTGAHAHAQVPGLALTLTQGHRCKRTGKHVSNPLVSAADGQVLPIAEVCNAQRVKAKVAVLGALLAVGMIELERPVQAAHRQRVELLREGYADVTVTLWVSLWGWVWGG